MSRLLLWDAVRAPLQAGEETLYSNVVRAVAALRDACQELGFKVEDNTEARGYASAKLKGDHVIRLKGPYDIAVTRQGNNLALKETKVSDDETQVTVRFNATASRRARRGGC